jgi:hypothetical protein
MTDTTHLRKLTDEVEAKFGDAGRVAVEPKAMRELLVTIDRLQLDKVRDALVIENLHSTIANLTAEKARAFEYHAAELADRTADRDSWADQCERRVQDVLRVAAERDALMVGASEMAAIEAQEPEKKHGNTDPNSYDYLTRDDSRYAIKELNNVCDVLRKIPVLLVQVEGKRRHVSDLERVIKDLQEKLYLAAGAKEKP